MTIQLGETAPDFTAEPTEGRLNLYEYLGDHWGVPFSHPADLTPVCTTELGAFANSKDEFTSRDTRFIGVSVDSVESHKNWSVDIAETQGQDLNYPLVGDENRAVANLFAMIHPKALETATVRTVYIIGPEMKVEPTLTYPASVGRNIDEILRVLDALQLTTGYSVSTPVDWKQGGEVIISPAISDEDAKTKFPKGFRTLKPYLRLTPQPDA